MLDPGRYFAEAIYFLQYTLAQILWAVNRAVLSVPIIAEGVNGWVTDNVGYFVQLLVNALSAPLGGMFILALTALGFWYALNNVVPTDRWVDPGKLATYGFIALFFFSSPIVVIDLMEELRGSLNAGIDQALIDGAAGDIFNAGMNGTDPGLPGGVPDVNSDGVIGSFDLAAAFILVANLDELDSSEFPVDFETTYFPFGDPSGIDLSDEADQELAKALASDGIERLLFALVAMPTAIAEHFLRLVLTGAAVFLYLGVPIAMVFAFFAHTQALLGAYLRQYVNLLIETLLSVIIVSIMLGLLLAAAQQGIGLYIAASLLVLVVLLWRIKSGFRLAGAAFNLFGGGGLTGGAGGTELVQMVKQAVLGAAGATAAVAGAAVTGGTTLVLGGAAAAGAAALQADGRSGGAYLGTDPEKTAGRVAQLKAATGYTLGRSETARHLVERAHEVRTLARNFRDGQVQEHDPDILDYLRAGSSMSDFDSNPWLAMHLSPPLRSAFDAIGGRRYGPGGRDAVFDGDGEPVSLSGGWRAEPATSGQRGYLAQMGLAGAGDPDLTRGEAGDRLMAEQGFRRFLAHGRRPDDDQQALLTRLIGLEQVLADLATVLNQGRPGSGEPPPPVAEETAASVGSPAGPAGGRPPASRVFLQSYSSERGRRLEEALEKLESPDTAAGQAAFQTLVNHAGPDNARLLQAAVTDHSAESVGAAAAAVAGMAAHYRGQGLDEAAVLQTFRSGRAAEALRQILATPLSDEQLAAAADLVLQPQRRLDRSELVAVIGREAAAGAVSDQAIIEAIGSPVGFGSQTGNVRGVLVGARDLNLSPAELSRLADLISDGLRETARQELAGRGHRPEQVRALIADIAALPAAITVPQSTAWPAAARQQQISEEDSNE
jgi:hypothetical protein